MPKHEKIQTKTQTKSYFFWGEKQKKSSTETIEDNRYRKRGKMKYLRRKTQDLLEERGNFTPVKAGKGAELNNLPSESSR